MSQIIDVVDVIDMSSGLPQNDQAVVSELVNNLNNASNLQQLIQYLDLDKYRKQVRVEGGLNSLFGHITNGPLENGLFTNEQILALANIAKMCNNLPTREEIRRMGGIPHLIACGQAASAKAPNCDKELVYVLQSLVGISDCDKNKSSLIDEGILDFILNAVYSRYDDFPDVVIYGLEILSKVASSNANIQNKVAASGLVPYVIQSLLSPPNTLPNDSLPSWQCAAADCLASISYANRKVQAQVRKTKGTLKSIGKLMDSSNDESVRRSAALAVGAVSEGDFANQNQLIKFGIVDDLMPIILNGPPENSYQTQKAVCQAFRSLARGNLKIQKIFKDNPVCLDGFIGLLIDQQQQPSMNVGLVCQCLHALTEITKDNKILSDAFVNADNSCESLLGLLDPETHKLILYAATGLIFALTKKNKKRAAKFQQLDARSILTPLKKHSDPKVKKGASWALENV
eukprot:TRINITY_DN4994_c0_g1_i1.p1 TRINITY_DN4994_c0_g1~~TRINITY_DN4994_c0_g1_i1.p1  ORF type:complete len:458 (-),score=168.71 TRINITY_DN4994_c0_g1_i1:99-1472(-)